MKLLWAVISGAGGLAGIVFMICYARVAKGLWFHYPIGWHLMGMSASLSTTMTLVFLTAVYGSPHRAWWLIVIGSVVVLMWVQVAILFTTTRSSRIGLDRQDESGS